MQASTQQILLMQKSLDQMNLQLHHVLSEITGSSGLAILDAILAGERDPAVLAGMRDRRVKSSAETIAKALDGDYRSEHLFTLRQSLTLYRFLEGQIRECLDVERSRAPQLIPDKVNAGVCQWSRRSSGNWRAGIRWWIWKKIHWLAPARKSRSTG